MFGYFLNKNQVVFEAVIAEYSFAGVTVRVRVVALPMDGISYKKASVQLPPLHSGEAIIGLKSIIDSELFFLPL